MSIKVDPIRNHLTGPQFGQTPQPAVVSIQPSAQQVKLYSHILEQQKAQQAQQQQRGLVPHQGQPSGAVLSYLRSMKTTAPDTTNSSLPQQQVLSQGNLHPHAVEHNSFIRSYHTQANGKSCCEELFEDFKQENRIPFRRTSLRIRKV